MIITLETERLLTLLSNNAGREEVTIPLIEEGLFEFPEKRPYGMPEVALTEKGIEYLRKNLTLDILPHDGKAENIERVLYILMLTAYGLTGGYYGRYEKFTVTEIVNILRTHESLDSVEVSAGSWEEFAGTFNSNDKQLGVIWTHEEEEVAVARREISLTDAIRAVLGQEPLYDALLKVVNPN